jgi:tetratricopeptide (TPR) repeat protein
MVPQSPGKMDKPQGIKIKQMKLHHKIIALILPLLCINQLLLPNTDSGTNEIQQVNNGPEEQFRALITLSVDNWKSAPGSSIIYGEEALAIAQKLNDERMEAEALNNIGVAYSYANAFGEALEYFFKALVIRENLDDPNLLAKTLNNIGNVYFISGNRDQAISY